MTKTIWSSICFNKFSYNLDRQVYMNVNLKIFGEKIKFSKVHCQSYKSNEIKIKLWKNRRKMVTVFKTLDIMEIQNAFKWHL